MITLSPAAVKVFQKLVSVDCKSWWENVRAFYAILEIENPGWQLGCKLVPNNGTVECDKEQWAANIVHMVNSGMSLKVEGCLSFWLIKSQTSTWAAIGRQSVIEFCYVAQYHDEFHGYATEYFPEKYHNDAFWAFHKRVCRDETTKETGDGYGLEDIAILNTFGAA